MFNDGRLVEVGCYDELVRRGGVFTELVLSSERGVTEDGPPAAGGVPGAA